MTSVGGKTTPQFNVFFSIVKTFLVHKTCLYILGYISCIFGRGVDASKPIALKGPALNSTRAFNKHIMFCVLPEKEFSRLAVCRNGNLELSEQSRRRNIY